MDLQPIVKWAGGKRWLTTKRSDLLPKDFNCYFEPFLGGGAVYFHLQPKRAVLSDINEELINVYITLSRNWGEVADALKILQHKHSPEFYYEMRASRPRTMVDRAVRTLYLNRTCWNGLYRVNLKGEFNVPIGTKTNILNDIDKFEAIAKLLADADITVGDFEKTIDCAQKDDFVFIDPPYTVKHNYNGFVKYNENLFSWEDQVRLSEAVGRAAARGVKVLVLNANHQSIRELYADFDQLVLSRSSVLSGKSEFRGVYQELAVRCWRT